MAPGIGWLLRSHCTVHGPFTLAKNVAGEPSNAGVLTGCSVNATWLQGLL